MIAWLGMYDLPELRDAHDRYWALIRENLGYGPYALSRDLPAWDTWRAPDLLLAQTCGMPYRTRLHGDVTLVGTPDYGLPDCPPGHYNSVLVARSDDARALPQLLAEGVFAYNEGGSQSGWSAPVTWFAQQGRAPERGLKTGAHAASARAVAEGRADLAALDAVTWTLLRAHDRTTDALREIARTDPTPGLPYITSVSHDPAPIAAAIRNAIAALDPADRADLHLNGLVSIPAKDYLAVPTPPEPAEILHSV
ncbi:phosphate/phosphite/phosphonate ABC transporter substrate-binding protein [Lutimaribacter marinistellae]|uniref:Phosphate/phosphite/phosphonate ABC transporter substrate-binding protein n=1 Tax=Lutimaribacter marinistellae TaxID=1820329 RepID=A0ABV7TKM4_9RHOB